MSPKARATASRTPIRQAVIDAFKAKGRASVQAHRAQKAAQPRTSWWLCPPDQFSGEAKKAADRMNTSSTLLREKGLREMSPLLPEPQAIPAVSL
jgi:hypothetical protein